eukprot:NODE_5450_length_675_cov_25.833866_g5075_i0.p1 GENE.NODE_5450_length_675_cov_25.833866_g5075_i0~~NODE_5450_length_675_cov_25.833866_g5075_i0.p1  ORF type:complete len:179 (+),score=47.71 NODE_5450_length_675_cov_25.833866_g5075_i0:42-539(+)
MQRLVLRHATRSLARAHLSTAPWTATAAALRSQTNNGAMQFRSFASHSDFSATPTKLNEDEMEAAIKEIKEDIAANRIVLFMKGEPRAPQCGFSARVIQILSEYGTKYIAYNVLADPMIRAGVKKISNWPTIPQLYVDGEFVGGCDIITELHQNGELKDVLAEKK